MTTDYLAAFACLWGWYVFLLYFIPYVFLGGAARRMDYLDAKHVLGFGRFHHCVQVKVDKVTGPLYAFRVTKPKVVVQVEDQRAETLVGKCVAPDGKSHIEPTWSGSMRIFGMVLRHEEVKHLTLSVKVVDAGDGLVKMDRTVAWANIPLSRMDLMLRFRKDAASNVDDVVPTVWTLEHAGYGQARWQYNLDGTALPLEDAENDLKLHMAVVVDKRKHKRPKNHARHARLRLNRIEKQKQKLQEQVRQHSEMAMAVGLGGSGRPGLPSLQSQSSHIDLKPKQVRVITEDSKHVTGVTDGGNPSFWAALKNNHSYIGPFLAYHPVYTRFERATILFAACVQTMLTSALWYGNTDPDSFFEQAVVIGASALIQGPITVILLLVFGLDMSIAEKMLTDRFGEDEEGESHDAHIKNILHGHEDSLMDLPEVGARLGYSITFIASALALYATNLFVVPMSDDVAMNWLNSQWSINIICIIIVEPVRCYLTWALGQVKCGPKCMSFLVALGCCWCCLESEEAIEKRASANIKKMQRKIKSKMKMDSLKKQIQLKRKAALALSRVDDEAEPPVPANLPEVFLLKHDDDWPTVTMWV
jgi:hypothetical protein